MYRNLLRFSRFVVSADRNRNGKIFYLQAALNSSVSGVIEDNKKVTPNNLPKMWSYPVARRDELVVDTYHGVKVADPYRWLEDPDAPETHTYIEANNKITEPYLSTPEWKTINKQLTALWNYSRYTCPAKHGNRYFFHMNTGLQNQNVMYSQTNLGDDPTVVLDPNTLSEDGTIALSGMEFSDNGHYFCYGLSESGSDWIKIKVRNVETGEDFPEVLEKVKFSAMTWTKDNMGFFYCRYPDQEGKVDGSETKMNENQKLYYHRIGQPQSTDVLVAEFPEEPTWRMSVNVSDCGKYMIVSVVKDCRDNLLFFGDLEKCGEIVGKIPLTQVVFRFESDYEYITNEGPMLYFRTNKNAPNYRVIGIDYNNPKEANWVELIKEHSEDVLDWAHCVDNNKLMLCYMHDVKSVLQVNSLTNGEFIKQFPLDIGTIIGFSGKKKYSEIFYQFMSFTTPGIIFHYDFAKLGSNAKVFREITVKSKAFDSSHYHVEQVFYKNNRDGTKIPMFIVQKRIGGQGPKPCLLYGYGGFNISIQPVFSITGLMFIDLFNGVLAFPNIRGGGEYGEKWHNAGRLLNKQNVFNDFQSAAMYLTENQITTRNKLVIQGGSNGGLLVGACINQRPDLFGAAIAQVGVMDMLRFNKFTIGHAWMSDYGNPDEKKHFENLMSYSPLHNVNSPKNEKNEYPATLILTADHDDRVSPLHSLKFAAAIHHAVGQSPYQKNPILLRVYSKAGHGAGKPTTKKIEEATDILAFMQKSMDLKIHGSQ